MNDDDDSGIFTPNYDDDLRSEAMELEEQMIWEEK